jgi:hypothetical protein
MSFKVISASLLAVFTFTTFAIADPQNVSILAAITTCKANPGCSHEQPDAAGAVLFKIYQKNHAKYIRCQKDGICMMVLPRGKNSKISDVTALLGTN